MTKPIDILLVDDEPRNLDALDAILTDRAYRTIRAQDADQALRLLLENDVAAIVLDIKMPGVSGIELAQMIKNTRRFRQTPIVFLTAYLLDDQHIIAGYDAGAVDYLTKPVNPQILRHKIAVFADLFRKTRELAQLNERLEERVKERTAELERSEAELRAAAYQKDEFLAVLAHELRNPLAPLRTGLDLLISRVRADDAGAARTLGAMDRQLAHMVRLIDDLLDVSRISRGVLELKRAPVDVGAIVEATVESTRPLFERRAQRLSTDITPHIQAMLDSTRVAQIVTNLLTNASKFTPVGGHVEVRVALEGGDAVIGVADDGAGVPVDQIERIFDMFARVNRASTPSESGLGIGLALARKLASMHGGSLTAASAGEGCGTTLRLSLPAADLAAVAQAAPAVAQAAPAVAQAAPADGAPLPGLRITVIEDNEDIAETLVMLLEELGHDVGVARTGQAGVQLVKQTKPDVVLCDLGLPEMSGVEVCRHIRALGGDDAQPVMIAITGWGRDEDRQRTRTAGFDYHLVKPVGIDDLTALLRSLAPRTAGRRRAAASNA